MNTTAPRWQEIAEGSSWEISLGAVHVSVWRSGTLDGWYASAPPFFERKRLSAADPAAAKEGKPWKPWPRCWRSSVKPCSATL